jgi:hypothetical protein
MSSREHRKDKKSESKDYSQQPRQHMGPSGFIIYEYKGSGKDHTVEWIRYQKNLRGAILIHKLDNLVERIIDKGKLPKLPSTDKKALMATAPKKNIRVSDLFDDEANSSTDSDDGDEEALQSKKSAPATVSAAASRKSKTQTKSPSETTNVIENPHYEHELAIWLDEVKAVNRKRVDRQMQLERDVETFYSIMWLQCGIAMQHHIQSMRDYEARAEATDTVWLYLALQAVGHNTAAISMEDAQTNTIFALAGVRMQMPGNLHMHVERWKQHYNAYVASGNAELTSSIQVDMCCRSLHDGYALYRADFQNRKNRGEKLPKTLADLINEASNYVTAVLSSATSQQAVFAIGDMSKYVKREPKKQPEPKKQANPKKQDPKPADQKKSDIHTKPKFNPDDHEFWKNKTCNSCHQLGHCAARCPELVSAAEDSEDDKPAAARAKHKKNGHFALMIAWNGTIPSQYLLALDDCAHTTVICNEAFAAELVRGNCSPLLSWMGESHSNEASGQLHPFGYCEVNKNTPINLLSEYEVRSRFAIEDRYDGPGPDQGVIRNPDFKIVHVGSCAIPFRLDNDTRQYVVDWRYFVKRFTYSPSPYSPFMSNNVVINSVRQNEAMFTKDEVRRAKKAREFIAHTGYASKEEAMRMVSSSGNILNVDISRADIQRAVDIYGSQHVLMGRSRLLHPDTRVVRAQPVPKFAQCFFCDIFYVGGIPFLLCKAKPLNLLIVHPLQGESADHLLEAFQYFINTMKSYKYEVDVIYFDEASAAVANINKVGTVRVENCAAGDHVDEIESSIKTVKERLRSVRSGIIFKLTARLITKLVLFIVGRINIGISQYTTDGLCARVRLTGVMLDMHKELRTGFGYLVVARNKNVVSNDGLAVRGEVCVTMHAVGNRQGSWVMLKLTTMKFVSRSQYVIVPMTDLAKQRLDEIAFLENQGRVVLIDDEDEYFEPEDVPDDEDYFRDGLRNVNFDFPFVDPNIKVEGGEVITVTPVSAAAATATADAPTADDTVHDELPIPPLVDDNDDDEPVVPKYTTKVQVTDDGRPTFTSTAASRDARMAAKNVRPAVNLVAGRRMSTKSRRDHRTTHVNIGNYNITHAACVKKYGARQSMRAQYKEIKALYENGTFEGIMPKDLTGSQKRKIIRSFIILKEKFNAEGGYEKLKARLVANGAQMDPSTHTDLSSPTVSLTFLLMEVVMAARERRKVATMDVGNAFVKATMDGEEEVLVNLDQISAALLIQIDPTFKRFLNERMEMTVLLKKALYGCLQSARLWFELLVKELMAFGYVQNPVEPCVLNKDIGGKQSTLLLHVDDIMVLSQVAEEISALHKHLESRFDKVTLHEGVKHNYLGMTFDFSVIGQVSITMLGYEADLVSDWFGIDFDEKMVSARDKFASDPASPSIFEKGDSPALCDKNSAIFHSYVMRIAFLAKRVKPELNVAISYLSTQVTRSSENDLRKLDRVIRYVRDHLGTGITLTAAGENKNVVVTAHIDASFGCHDDAKSHTGVCITLGQGPVYVRSVKQRIVTKSSTEAELVALSDEAGLIFHVEDFLTAQGYTCDIIIGQDNQSTIQMISTTTKENMRTKHIKVRYFWLRERVKKGELTIVYVPTGDMLADMLTKPMRGNLFRHFVAEFCNRGEVVPTEE